MVPIVTIEIFRAAEDRLQSITRRVYSTAEIETGLARLLAERGHLSGRFVQQCSYLPSPEAIDSRYGSLAAAFRKVGFEIPSRIKKNPTGLPYSDDDLLGDLRRIYQHRGYLSGHAVDADPNSPSKKYFVRRFGSLAKAFELAGVDVTSTERRRAAIAFRDENGLCHKPPKKAVRRNLDGSAITDDQLLGHLRRLLREHGYLSVPLIDADPEVPAKNLFRRRFGGLRAAYERVGFFSNQSDIVRAAHARLAA
jgi:hypothetical protein